MEVYLSVTMVGRIRLLCSQQGHTLASVEKELGFGNGSINKWDKNTPSIEKVATLAYFLEVSIDFLYSGVISTHSDFSGIELSSDEESLLSRYRLLNMRDKEAVSKQIDDNLARTFTNAPKAGSQTLSNGNGNMEETDGSAATA